MIKLKDLLNETSIWSPGTGMGTKTKPITTLSGRIKPHNFKNSEKYIPPHLANLSSQQRYELDLLPPQKRSVAVYKLLKKYRKDNGLCIRCGGKALKKSDDTTSVFCSIHSDEDNQRQSNIRKIWIAQGKCKMCGDDVTLNKDGSKSQLCPIHQEKSRQHYQTFVQKKNYPKFDPIIENGSII